MDIETGDLIYNRQKAHKGSVYSISFSPDGKRFATCSADKTIKIWETEEIKQLQ